MRTQVLVLLIIALGLMTVVVNSALNNMIVHQTMNKHGSRIDLGMNKWSPISVSGLLISTTNSSGNVSMNIIDPISSSLRKITYRLVSRPEIFNAQAMLEIMPSKYVDGYYLGANINYSIVFYAIDPDGLDDLSWINLTIRDNKSRVLVISYNGNNVNVVSNFTNIRYEARKILNTTFKVGISIKFSWNESLKLDIVSILREFPGGVHVDRWRFVVVNKTMVSSIDLPRKEYKMSERVEFVAHLVYYGTNIPAPNETVFLRYRQIQGLSGLVTNNDGEVTIIFKAPSKPGAYNIIIEPEHGEPYTFEITVLNEYSGYPIIRFKPLLLLTAMMIIILFILLIYRYLERK